MFQKKMFFILVVICNVSIQAQKKMKADFEYKISYNLSYSLDSTDLNNRKSEVMVLFCGDGISTFSSKAKLFKNSVVVKGNTASTSKESLTDFPYVIIKNPEQKKIYYTLQIVDDYLYYDENINLFEWKLQKETKDIKGFIAQKATLTYFGRNYVAWFTTEIPISDGPYKFNGLPGLILEIHDDQNHYNFTLLSFEKLDTKIPFKVNLNQYILTDRKNLFEVYYRYKKDPFTYVNNPNVKITPEVHQEYIKRFSELLAKENNRIEKN